MEKMIKAFKILLILIICGLWGALQSQIFKGCVISFITSFVGGYLIAFYGSKFLKL